KQEPPEIVDPVHVVVDEIGLDHVFPFRLAAVPDAFEHRQAYVHREFLGVAEEPFSQECAVTQLPAVIGRTEREGRRNIKPRTKMKWYRHGRREFAALDKP